MAGNVREWTTENAAFEGNTVPYHRGGDFYSSGSIGPAACRLACNDSGISRGNGFRVVLYK